MNKLLKNEIDEMNEVMEEEVTRFKVDSLDSANWCFRKIRALQEEINTNTKLADEERARIDAWEKSQNKQAENSIAYFEGLLIEYYKSIKETDPRAKVNTPYGRIMSRKTKKWDYNEEEVLEWAKNNGYREFIRVKEELDKSILKKTFKDGVDSNTGEIIPGVSVEEIERISIKVE